MIVVLAVGITALWIGACIFRKHYLRKKEMQYELRPPKAPWVGGQAAGRTPYGDGVLESGKGKRPVETYVTAADARLKPKAEKQKWIVKERT